MVKEGLFEKMTSDLRLEKSQNWSCKDLWTEQSTKREWKVQNPTDKTQLCASEGKKPVWPSAIHEDVRI